MLLAGLVLLFMGTAMLKLGPGESGPRHPAADGSQLHVRFRLEPRCSSGSVEIDSLRSISSRGAESPQLCLRRAKKSTRRDTSATHRRPARFSAMRRGCARQQTRPTGGASGIRRPALAQPPECGEGQPKAESDGNRSDPTPARRRPYAASSRPSSCSSNRNAPGPTPTVANIFPPGDQAVARWDRSRTLV